MTISDFYNDSVVISDTDTFLYCRCVGRNLDPVVLSFSNCVIIRIIFGTFCSVGSFRFGIRLLLTKICFIVRVHAVSGWEWPASRLVSSAVNPAGCRASSGATSPVSAEIFSLAASICSPTEKSAAETRGVGALHTHKSGCSFLLNQILISACQHIRLPGGQGGLCS